MTIRRIPININAPAGAPVRPGDGLVGNDAPHHPSQPYGAFLNELASASQLTQDAVGQLDPDALHMADVMWDPHPALADANEAIGHLDAALALEAPNGALTAARLAHGNLSRGTDALRGMLPGNTIPITQPDGGAPVFAVSAARAEFEAGLRWMDVARNYMVRHTRA